MHQPLHTASLFSPTLPDGDSGGNEQFVIDPATNGPVTLHWFWDDAVHRSGEASGVLARAREIEARHARASLRELRERPARNFRDWSFGESFYPLGLAYSRSEAPGSGAARDLLTVPRRIRHPIEVTDEVSAARA
jgi:hypothetical protein